MTRGIRFFGPPGSPPPSSVLADAVVLLRASSFAGADGDPWPNEGTGGSDFDAVPVGEPEGPPWPEFVASPEPGFVTGQDGEDPLTYFEVPTGAAIDITGGPITVAWRGVWTDDAQGPFDPIVAKITGQPGVDGHGWVLVDGSAIGGAGVVLADGEAFAGGLTGAPLGEGEHLLVARLDRVTDEVVLFVDGTPSAAGDASAVASIASTNPIVIGRTTTRTQTVRDLVVWDRALTDTEITDDLPTALGV